MSMLVRRNSNTEDMYDSEMGGCDDVSILSDPESEGHYNEHGGYSRNNSRGGHSGYDMNDIDGDTDDEDDDSVSSTDEDEEEDDSLAFPPGFSKDKSNVDIPAYFICPITKSIMRDPVIDREGNTYERKAIIRWLDLEDVSPLSRNPLSKTDLVPNRAVADAIEKARREAWFQYRKQEDKEKEREDRNRRRAQAAERHGISRKEGKERSDGRDSRDEHRGSSHKETKSSSKKYERSKSQKHDEMLAANNNRLLLLMQQELDMLKKQQNDLLQQQKEQQQKDDHQQQKEPREQKSSKSSRRSDSKNHGESTSNSRSSSDRSEPEASPHRPNKSAKDPAPSSSSSTPHSTHSGSVPRPPPPPRRDGATRRRANGLASSSTQGSANSHPHGSSSSRHVSSSGGNNSHAQPPAPTPAPIPASPPATTSAPSPQPGPPSSSSSSSHTVHASNTSSVQSAHAAHTAPQSSSTSATMPASVAAASVAASAAASQGSVKESVLHNGWSVPIGVHKVICAAPGLAVTVDVHRRSTPLKQFESCTSNSVTPAGASTSGGSRRSHNSPPDLVIPPGTYVDVVETQVHGGRIRGKVVWEVEVQEMPEEDNDHDKFSKRRSSMMIPLRGPKKNKEKGGAKVPVTTTKQYVGWISLRWVGDADELAEGGGGGSGSGSGSGSSKRDSKDKDGRDGRDKDGKDDKDRKQARRPSLGRKKSKSVSPCPADAKVTDEDSGPWTQPVTLGVYRINFGNGLPLRDSPNRDSKLLGLLERGRYVEVVETQVKGDRVRARCIVPPSDNDSAEKFTSGWISLFNAVTGSSGATLVPLGAYVTVSESGCVVTEGGSVDSKVKSFLSRGTCIEIVASRIEEGLVRGLVSTGGHVTLIGKTKETKGHGSKRSEGSQETFLMPVPCGTYKILYPTGLPVSAGSDRNSTVTTKLKQDTCVEVVETSVEDGRVRGRIQAIVNGNARKDISGWISLFEPSCRWAKFVFL